MKITKEQIENLSLTDDVRIKAQLKEWFPKAFETKLEVGKWYKDTEKGSNLLFFYEEKGHDVLIGYGFGTSGNWSYNKKWLQRNEHRELLRPATDKEVEAALIAEAKKRGYDKLHYKCICKGHMERCINDKFYMLKENLYLGSNSRCDLIFRNGQWAEIIPTMTKEEAEKKLNCKIVYI